MHVREFVVKDPKTGKFAAFQNVTDKFTTPFLTQTDFIQTMAMRAYEEEKNGITKFFEYGFDTTHARCMAYKEAIRRYESRNTYGVYDEENDFYPVDIVNGAHDMEIRNNNKKNAKS